MLTDAQINEQFSDNSRDVLERRYLRKNQQGEVVESIPEMFRRVSRHVAAVDEDPAQAEELFFDTISRLELIPSSPVFMNAGEKEAQLAACFVTEIPDSMDGILLAMRTMGLIQKSGGGNGFSFSRLRPKNAPVGESGGKSSGPIGFMRAFDAVSKEIVQGHKRRGANMATLRVDHPDIEDFIACKAVEGSLSHFNISVGITDKFMTAVKNDSDFDLVFPDVTDTYYKKFNGTLEDARELSIPIVTYKTIKARDLFAKIVEGAWRNGEPGVLFLDTANRDNPTPQLGRFEATNPCISGDTVVITPDGERKVSQLVNYENRLYLKLFDTYYQTTPGGFFCTGIKPTIKIETANGYNIKVTNNHKLLKYENNDTVWEEAENLSIGDLVVISKDNPSVVSSLDKIVKISFGEPEPVFDVQVPGVNAYSANHFVSHNCGEIFLLPSENCCLASINLAKNNNTKELAKTAKTGVHYLDNVIDSNYYVKEVPQLKHMAQSIRRIGLGIMGLADLLFNLKIRYGSAEAVEFCHNLMQYIRDEANGESERLADLRGVYPAWQAGQPKRRNAALLAIAPTGTIATIAGAEGYGCEPVFALAYTREVTDGDKKLTLRYESPLFVKALQEANVPDIDRILTEVAKTGSCKNVTGVPEEIRRVFVTAADVTPEEHVRMQAALQEFVDNSISKTINMPQTATKEDVWQAYMLAWELGCKGLTVYRAGSRESEVLKVAKEEPVKKSLKRPVGLAGMTYKTPTPLGTAYTTINHSDDGQPFEVFLNVGKAGSDTSAVAEAMGRLISIYLQSPSDMPALEKLQRVIDQLEYIGGGRPLGFGHNRVLSLPDGVAQALKQYLGAEVMTPVEDKKIVGDLCPVCGQATMVYIEGCNRCTNCGNSGC